MRVSKLVAAVTVWALACPSVHAFSVYLDAWKARYPDSTLPERMNLLTGTECHVCHHPPTRNLPGNCYRMDLFALLDGGASIQDALDQLDGQDSDGDGVANGVEINLPRSDDPGQVGYSPGLIGETGTDPCADDPDEVVTSARETPILLVPASSTWGAIIFGLSVALGGSVVIRRQRPASYAT